MSEAGAAARTAGETVSFALKNRARVSLSKLEDEHHYSGFDYVMKPVDFAHLERAIIAAAGLAPPDP